MQYNWVKDSRGRRARTVPRGEYHAYLQSEEWQAVRARFWASRLPKECYCCGDTESPKDLHHKTYDHLGNESLLDLVPLCRPCHHEVHARFNSGVYESLKNATNSLRRDNKRNKGFKPARRG